MFHNEGKVSQKFFYTHWKTCSKRKRMEESSRGSKLHNLLKFRHQIRSSLQYTGLHPDVCTQLRLQFNLIWASAPCISKHPEICHQKRSSLQYNGLPPSPLVKLDSHPLLSTRWILAISSGLKRRPKLFKNLISLKKERGTLLDRDFWPPHSYWSGGILSFSLNTTWNWQRLQLPASCSKLSQPCCSLSYWSSRRYRTDRPSRQQLVNC